MHIKLPSKINVMAVSALAIAVLNGCGEKIDGRQTEINQGLIYKLHSDTPFSGKISNYNPTKLGFMVHGNCNVEVAQGILDGPAECLTDSGAKLADFAYKNGKQNGEIKIWDENTKNLIVKFHVLDGYKDGIEEYYNPENNKLVRQTNWSKNSKNGSEKVWDITGEILLTNLTWKDEKKTGFVKSGERENNYIDGDEKGTQRRYTLIDGDYDSQKKYIAQTAVANLYKADYFVGLLDDGKYKVIDLEDEHKKSLDAEKKQYEDIKAATAQSACVDKKTTDYHMEKGETAFISNDMIQDWREECKSR
ncbi:toxin-antitoxin system YwqK family antitoxin [Rugamonas rivuli]|uniref:Uncharacterized protein n=1 Tax=Rugamonas rivuli TaxID=2743358 RepID=A0A843SMK8_9BURK|nr:hypothetical protein [Rugamonas rivuli]MQA21526.1 hypothetical protein [Rugamonas rivuli]